MEMEIPTSAQILDNLSAQEERTLFTGALNSLKAAHSQVGTLTHLGIIPPHDSIELELQLEDALKRLADLYVQSITPRPSA